MAHAGGFVDGRASDALTPSATQSKPETSDGLRVETDDTCRVSSVGGRLATAGNAVEERYRPRSSGRRLDKAMQSRHSRTFPKCLRGR